MRGDYSRVTFDPAKQYSRVLLQQGRVLLDADFNEQAAILLEQQRMAMLHLVGDHGGPEANLGFQVSDLNAAQGDFKIGKGAYYVAGVLCYNPADIRYKDQGGLALSGAHHGSPFTAPQTFRIYLEVTEREVSSLEDPSIREVALGGPDTCWRSVYQWMVKAEPSNLPFPRLSSARMRAGVETPAKKSDTPCSIPPDSRYRGAENQLYRVEIHQAAEPGRPAVFKWSRENGSVIYAIKPPSGKVVQLAGSAPDPRFQIPRGSFVQLLDDAHTAAGKPGELIEVTNFDSNAMTVELKSNAPTLDANGHPRLIRWEGTAPVTESNDPASGWIPMENGIRVQFEPAAPPATRNYVPGDYWLIPARTIGGVIEWPANIFRDSYARRFHAVIGEVQQPAAGAVLKVSTKKFAGWAS